MPDEQLNRRRLLAASLGAAATLLGCAMLVVASGSLLPSIEDWFGARHELRTIQPLLDELSRRHPNVGIGVRPPHPSLGSLIKDGTRNIYDSPFFAVGPLAVVVALVLGFLLVAQALSRARAT